MRFSLGEISRPPPKSTSASPTTTARRFSIHTDDVVVLPARERLHADRQPIAGRVQVRLARISGSQPVKVGAAAGSLLGGGTVLPHQVLLTVGRRRERRP